MSKEILVVLNRKRGSVKAQLTRIKDFINNPDEKDQIKLESKMDTLKNLRIKLSDIRNEYYEVVANDSDLEPLELEILDLEDDCEDIQIRKQGRNYELNLVTTKLPKWDDFMDFLLKRCLILENIQTNNAIAVPSERSNKTKSFLAKLDPVNCVICKQQPHPVFRCKKFNDLSVNERFNSVKKNNLCINCFSSSHRVALCKSPRSCPNCSKRHNSLLCRNFERRVDSQRSQISETLSTLESKSTTTLNVNSECFKPKQAIPYVESFENDGRNW
ncbi:uncharacterized protein TNCT_37621 [Trichonephila clavata]|uniref:Uncharacterized protein n=1 Tax=Trichonephila clavata TaxID=2740835 RepID=A0A8X6HF67_TRICU|nr:uncharacterized protein TNCT_37621 [Trichonephila clavata]